MELLEIEKELAGPEKESALQKYDEVLLRLDARLKAALREGLPPDEYDRAEQLADALVVARKLLRLQVRGDAEAKKKLFVPVTDKPWIS